MERSLLATIKKGIRISLALSVIVILIILLLTVEEKTLEAFHRLRPLFLVLTVLVWGAFVYTDGLRVSILTRASNNSISVKRAIEIILVGNFMAAVTPFQTGGFPVQLLLFNKDNIGPGRAMAYIAFRGILIYVPVYLAAPFLILGHLASIQNWIVQALVKYFFFLLFVIIALVFYGLVKPRMAEKFLLWLKKKTGGKTEKVIDFLLLEMAEFRKGMGIYLKEGNERYLLLAILVSIFSLSFYIGITPTLLYGLGVSFSFTKAVMIHVLLMALLLYIPTPGAGGVAEAGAAALFALVCPKHLLGIFVILWRFFTFQLGALIGGIITIKEL